MEEVRSLLTNSGVRTLHARGGRGGINVPVRGAVWHDRGVVILLRRGEREVRLLLVVVWRGVLLVLLLVMVTVVVVVTVAVITIHGASSTNSSTTTTTTITAAATAVQGGTILEGGRDPDVVDARRDGGCDMWHGRRRGRLLATR